MTRQMFLSAVLMCALLFGCGGPKNEEPAVGKNEPNAGKEPSQNKKPAPDAGKKSQADKRSQADKKKAEKKKAEKAVDPLKSRFGGGKSLPEGKPDNSKGEKKLSPTGPSGNKSAEKKSLPKPAPPSIDELLRKAQQAISARQLVPAIEHLSEVAKQSPTHASRLTLVQLLQQHGLSVVQTDPPRAYGIFKESARHAREFVGDRKVTNPQVLTTLSQAYYNEACAYAIEKDLDTAFKSLEASVVNGFAGSKANVELYRTDKDLTNLRGDDRYKKLLVRVDAAYQATVQAAIKKAEELLAKFEPVDFSFELPDSEAKPVSSEDFRDKVLIVNFWGTWARPSLDQVPALIKLKSNNAGKALEIVGINLEQGNPGPAVAQFQRASGMNYPSLAGNRETAQKIQLSRLPTTLIMDRTGKVRMRFETAQPLEVLQHLATKLMNESAPSAAKKAETKKAETKKAETKKAETKKAETKKADAKKAETKKAETKKAETKKAETKKADAKKAETKKAETKKAETKKADTKKAETKKADTKKAETKKADTKKAETKKDG